MRRPREGNRPRRPSYRTALPARIIASPHTPPFTPTPMTTRAALLLLLLSATAGAQQRIKVFISVDMEGVAGVVTSDP